MTAVILTIHVLIVLALIVVVLLQRSDGGALGLGGGSGGGFMTGRGAANALTRTTSILAALFFATSLVLAIRAGGGEDAQDIIEELTGETAPAEIGEPGAPTTDDILNRLGGGGDDDAGDDVGPSLEGAATPLNEQEILDALGADSALPTPGDSPADPGGEASQSATETPSEPESGAEPPNN